MSITDELGKFFAGPGSWSLNGGIPERILQHLGYTAMAVAIAAVIAVPVGLYIGHTRRFAVLAINIGNAGRALPTLGLLTLIVTVIGIGLVPSEIALVVLAIPPLLSTSYAGIVAVDRATADAARGVGMREMQVLFRAEIPMALPIMLSGLRSATLQVVSTATVAAYVALGGLGRYLIDGLANFNYGTVLGGAILVALLAVVLDLLLAGVQRLVVSPGITGRVGRRRRTKNTSARPARSPA
ncbi:MAG: ABC transporter permease [Sciscionella sp.]